MPNKLPNLPFFGFYQSKLDFYTQNFKKRRNNISKTAFFSLSILSRREYYIFPSSRFQHIVVSCLELGIYYLFSVLDGKKSWNSIQRVVWCEVCYSRQ